jgi:putative hydrolase of the HAD superfamily
MTTKNKKRIFIVLDLDDTIYKEIDFVKSGFNAIIKKYAVDQHDYLLDLMFHSWKNGHNAIEALMAILPLKEILVEDILYTYHSHSPTLQLPKSSELFFKTAIGKGFKLGLITDGRSITQRNKLRALGIESFFEKIIISEEFGSEKPDISNFKIFESEFPNYNFSYIGDNLIKDFIAPRKLGWQVYCIRDDGNNIHRQTQIFPDDLIPIDTINDYFNNI